MSTDDPRNLGTSRERATATEGGERDERHERGGAGSDDDVRDLLEGMRRDAPPRFHPRVAASTTGEVAAAYAHDARPVPKPLDTLAPDLTPVIVDITPPPPDSRHALTQPGERQRALGGAVAMNPPTPPALDVAGAIARSDTLDNMPNNREARPTFRDMVMKLEAEEQKGRAPPPIISPRRRNNTVLVAALMGGAVAIVGLTFLLARPRGDDPAAITPPTAQPTLSGGPLPTTAAATATDVVTAPALSLALPPYPSATALPTPTPTPTQTPIATPALTPSPTPIASAVSPAPRAGNPRRTPGANPPTTPSPSPPPSSTSRFGGFEAPQLQ